MNRRTATRISGSTLAALAVVAGLSGCSVNPMDAAACKAFFVAQSAYDDTANKAVADNSPVNSGLWTVAWKALPTGVSAAAQLAGTDELKQLFAKYTTVLEGSTNAAEVARTAIWNEGYAQAIVTYCVNTKAASDSEFTPIK